MKSFTRVARGAPLGGCRSAPKRMVRVVGRPMLWHITMHNSSCGIDGVWSSPSGRRAAACWGHVVPWEEWSCLLLIRGSSDDGRPGTWSRRGSRRPGSRTISGSRSCGSDVRDLYRRCWPPLDHVCLWPAVDRRRRPALSTLAHTATTTAACHPLFGQRLHETGRLASMVSVGGTLDNTFARSSFAVIQAQLLGRRDRSGSRTQFADAMFE